MARFDPIEVSDVGLAYLSMTRDAFKALASNLIDVTVPGRAQSIALTELESAHRAVNRAIAEANRKEN